MVERITYQDNLVAGQVFTAEMADEIRDVVNALGTAADVNTGTAAGNVPVLDASGKLAIGVIPDAALGGGGGGGGTGDVTGPNGASDGAFAAFDGTSGTVLKELSVGDARTLLNVQDGATDDQTGPEIVTLLEALTTTARLEYTGVNGLDSSGAGALVLTAIDANLSPGASQFMRRNSADSAFEFASLGTGAFVTAMPVGAPTSASSTAGAVTLSFADTDFLTTTTTEAITTITVSNLASYSFGFWLVQQTTARNLTFPAATVMFGNSGLLLYTGVANSKVFITFYNDNGTLYALIGDAGVVGA
jgi:hypothetical protein